MVIYLQRFRKICIGAKIRTAHILKFHQHVEILVRLISQPLKLVIINKEVASFILPFLTALCIIEGNEIARIKICRFNLRNLEFSHAIKNHLLLIFKSFFLHSSHLLFCAQEKHPGGCLMYAINMIIILQQKSKTILILRFHEYQNNRLVLLEDQVHRTYIIPTTTFQLLEYLSQIRSYPHALPD